VHPNPEPHPPQLLVSVCSLMHAPLQALKPVLHVKVHELFAHVAVALDTPVEHVVVQVPQWLAFVVVLTHVLPPQRVGVDVGQPETQTEFEQYGVPLSAPQG
jgi:hypothetical protein